MGFSTNYFFGSLVVSEQKWCFVFVFMGLSWLDGRMGVDIDVNLAFIDFVDSETGGYAKTVFDTYIYIYIDRTGTQK